MNFTAMTVLGLALGLGQPAADYYPMKTRTLKLDIDYKPEQRKQIQRVELCVSADQGQVWEVRDAVTPDKDHFVYNAPADGIYWLNMKIVFRDGKSDPPDVHKAPPAMKVLIDATPPVVRILSAQRVGEEIVVDWTIEDKYPNDAATQVQFKGLGPAATGEWLPVPSGSINKRTARFKPGSQGPIAVQVTGVDLAGNQTSLSQEVAAGTTVSYTPNTQPVSAGGVKPGLEAPTVGATGGVVPAMENPALPGPIAVPGVVAPPTIPMDPAAAPAPIPAPAPAPAPTVTPSAPAAPPMVVVSASPTPAPAPAPAPAPSPAPAPIATATPNPTWTQPGATTMSDPALQPIAVGAGSAPPPSPATQAQIINYLRFDLQYQLENGPSGVSRTDLYVTRDDGKSWVRWSQHDGRETPLKVQLDTRFNQQPEGDYGFKLVPVSGAGLSDGAPAPGTVPEMRVHVDMTPPMIKVFAPTADPAQRNLLKLHWEATDKNFGRDPIMIEWSEQPTGPWKNVVGTEAPSVYAASQPGNLPMSARLPNTGTYNWQLPVTLGTHKVYLKFTAWDAAGNPSVVITPSPITVDLTTPRAKIQGIATTVVPTRP